MDIKRISDTITDLKALRSAIDPAIEHLERAYAALKALGINAPDVISSITEHRGVEAPANGHRSGSHFDHGIKVLESFGRPMHVDDITAEVVKLTGKNITRATIDGAISRHIRDAKVKLIQRISPGVYALTNSPNSSASLSAKTARPKRERQTRGDQLADFIRSNGPQFRKDLTAKAGIPEGSLSMCLNDKNRFSQLSDGRWDLIDGDQSDLRLG